MHKSLLPLFATLLLTLALGACAAPPADTGAPAQVTLHQGGREMVFERKN